VLGTNVAQQKIKPQQGIGRAGIGNIQQVCVPQIQFKSTYPKYVPCNTTQCTSNLA